MAAPRNASDEPDDRRRSVVVRRCATEVAADNSVVQLSAKFTICGDPRHSNCIVDGDTFWFRRQKIRMADIDAPELSPPRCADERQKGEATKQHLMGLLNAGPFALSIGARDEDRHSRKLRIVTLEGRSLGEMLVDDGLARC
jgi:endonuclease YncB( thermonuclease family)